jgi:hypothetical protein
MHSFLRKLKKPGTLLLAIAVVGAVVVLVIEISVGLPSGALLAAIIFLLGVITAGLLTERMQYFEPIMASLHVIEHAGPATVAKFYANRDELENFKDEIRDAHKEIFVVGNVMGGLLQNCRDSLTAKMREGCTVRLLMLDPFPSGKENPLLPLLAEITCNVGFDKLARYTMESLIGWHKGLEIENPEVAARLEIRFYSTLVTLAILFLDASSPSGKIRVELLPHRFEGRERPSFDLHPREGGELYRFLYQRYNELWNSSTPLSELAPATS